MCEWVLPARTHVPVHKQSIYIPPVLVGPGPNTRKCANSYIRRYPSHAESPLTNGPLLHVSCVGGAPV